MLIVGGVFVIGGIITIPIIVGLFCTPLGLFLMFLGILMSNPKQTPVIVNQQHSLPLQGYVHVGYDQQKRPVYAPKNK